jgi:hypothetical protein
MNAINESIFTVPLVLSIAAPVAFQLLAPTEPPSDQ